MSRVRWRSRITASVRMGVPRVILLLQRLWPVRAWAVVRGYPAMEGNAVEVVRALTRRYRGRVAWIDGPPIDVINALGIPADKVQSVPPMRSWRAVRAYLTAEVVFFTHGLYGEPPPGPHRVTVNVWHGEPIKGGVLFPQRRAPGPSSTYLVGSSVLLADRKLSLAGLGAGAHLLVGNPRTDGLFRPASDDVLASLGIDAARPYVMWMPTFRVADTGKTSWSDTVDPDLAADVTGQFRACAIRLRARGLQVVVRPHPLDAHPRGADADIVVLDEDLKRTGVTLYQVLGRAAGLISDVSSVWVDYLMIDRPMAFFMPDASAMANGRDIFPLADLGGFPGTELRDSAASEYFADDVFSGGELTRALRTEVRDRLGLVQSRTVSDDLIDMLHARGALRRGGVMPRGERP